MGGDAAAVRSRRLVVLVVLGVLCTVTLAPHVRLYVEQEQHQADVRADIAAREASVADLRRQQELWGDDAFVAAAARERLHYVFPGETAYVVAPELLAGEQGVDASGRASGTATGPSGGRGDGGAGAPWYRELWNGFGAASEASGGQPGVDPAGGPAVDSVAPGVDPAAPVVDPAGVPGGEETDPAVDPAVDDDGPAGAAVEPAG